MVALDDWPECVCVMLLNDEGSTLFFSHSAKNIHKYTVSITSNTKMK
jgi:hypothetical protein